MFRAEVNGITLSYRIHGSGEPLVLIGGYTMVKESWELQVAELAKLFSVITFDNRGVGGSTVPSEPFTIGEMAADAVGLMDYLGVDSAHVFGVSMGGLIAQLLVLDHRRRVRRVALGCTTHGGRHAVHPGAEVMPVLALAADPEIPAEEAVRARVPLVYSERFIREEVERLEGFVQFDLAHWPTPQGAAGQIGALSVFNVRRRLGEIRRPVLALTGSEDRVVLRENARLLAEGIPGARLYVVEGAGHFFFRERPREVNRVLLDFFSSQSLRPAT